MFALSSARDSISCMSDTVLQLYFVNTRVNESSTSQRVINVSMSQLIINAILINDKENGLKMVYSIWISIKQVWTIEFMIDYDRYHMHIYEAIR